MKSAANYVGVTQVFGETLIELARVAGTRVISCEKVHIFMQDDCRCIDVRRIPHQYSVMAESGHRHADRTAIDSEEI